MTAKRRFGWIMLWVGILSSISCGVIEGSGWPLYAAGALFAAWYFDWHALDAERDRDRFRRLWHAALMRNAALERDQHAGIREE